MSLARSLLLVAAASSLSLLMLTRTANAQAPTFSVFQSSGKEAVKPHWSHAVSVLCPEGLAVVGGGFSSSGDPTRLVLRESRPVFWNSSGWTAEVMNVSDVQTENELSVWAVCTNAVVAPPKAP